MHPGALQLLTVPEATHRLIKAAHMRWMLKGTSMGHPEAIYTELQRQVQVQVDQEDFSWDVSESLASCVQSFTKAEHHRMLLPRPVPLMPDAFYKISADIRVLGCQGLPSRSARGWMRCVSGVRPLYC